MKAWNLYDIGDIRFEDADKPKPSDGEVLIKVKATGICGSDIPRIYKTGAHNMPLIPGHEFAGEVVECGEKADKNLIGKRVSVFPLIPCKRCPQCKNKLYEMCENYDFAGSRSDGAFAEYVKVPEWNVIEIPDKIAYEKAAMLEPMGVAVHAMRSAQIEPESLICVSGAGTIGLLLIGFLIDAGYKNIFVIGNKDFQKEKAAKIGINPENFCDIREINPLLWINEKTDEKGVDIFFECVGKNDSLSLGVAAASAKGQIVLVGNPASDMTLLKDVYWRITRKQLKISGIWNSSFTKEETDDWHYVLSRLPYLPFDAGEFITHRFKIEDLEKGFHIMRDKSEDYIKILMLE
ncbi:MAG: galactitol-1-phosphate 5-dehydrogenase [Eubacterium sp.]|nr:galactitol-1-phosphate 5-dehydrogenase [Eubacterium sp.]